MNMVLLNRGRDSNDYCLDDRGFSGVQLNAWICHGASNQMVQFDDFERIMILNRINYATSPGIENSVVTLSSSSNNENNQKWIWDENERLQSKANTTLCMDLENSSGRNGVMVVMKPCSNAITQKWYRYDCGVRKDGNRTISGCRCNLSRGDCNGILNLANKNSITCLRKSPTEESELSFASCQPSDEQQFTFDTNMRLVTNDMQCVYAPKLSSGERVSLTTNCSSTDLAFKWFARENTLRPGKNRNLCLSRSSGVNFPILETCVPNQPIPSGANWVRISSPPGNMIMEDGFTAKQCTNGTFKNISTWVPCSVCPVGTMSTRSKLTCAAPDFSFGVTLLAGSGTSSSFNGPLDIAVDPNDNVIVADTHNHMIKRITPQGVISTIAGSSSWGLMDGPASSAQFLQPMSIAADRNGTIYVIDGGENSDSCRLRRISNQQVRTWRNGFSSASDTAVPTESKFNAARNVVLSKSGSIYVIDTKNNLIKKLDLGANNGVLENQVISGNRKTLVFSGGGSSLLFEGQRTAVSCNEPVDATFDDDEANMYFIDKGDNQIKKINMQSGMVSVMAGNYRQYDDIDGQGTMASLNLPKSIVYHRQLQLLFFIDAQLRYMDLNRNVKTFPFDTFGSLSAIAVDSLGNLIIADSNYHAIYKIIFCPQAMVWNYNIGKCECKPGFQSVGATCSACPAGMFKSLSGNSTNCAKCPDLTFANVAGSSTCSQCPLHSLPNANNTECIGCPAGFHRPNPNSKNCTECQPGTFKAEDGISGCALCPPSMFNVVTSSRSCSPCPINFQANSTRTGCEVCPAGQHRPLQAMQSCNQCPLGFFKSSPGSFNCTQCPIGTQSSSNFSFCEDCRQGTFRDSLDSELCMSCPLRSICNATEFKCLEGNYLNKNMKTCEQCLNGFYKNTIGNEECQACIGGFSSDDFKTCFTCPHGKYLNRTDGECKICGPGQQPVYDRTSCMDCPIGTFKPTGSLVCINCLDGAECDTTSYTCKPGHEFRIGSYGCQPCALGWVKSTYSNEERCISCDAGTEPNQNKTACTPCRSGTYRADSQFPQCVSCPANTASCDAYGFSCLQGYRKNSGGTSCILSRDNSGQEDANTEISPYETASKDPENRDPKDNSFQWSTFYMYPIAYAFMIPILVLLIGIVIYMLTLNSKSKSNRMSIYQRSKPSVISGQMLIEGSTVLQTNTQVTDRYDMAEDASVSSWNK